MSISLICEKIYKKDIILYSIITPIYNQQDIIVHNIKSYINYTEDNFEIILIIDCCSDNTKNNILHFINNYNNISKNFCQIKIYETDEPFFETKCDNFGFKIAQGKYLLEIQADMEMIELGYNKHLTKPFNILNNVIAVSGRCGHNLFRDGGIGKLGLLVEKNISELKLDKNCFYSFETCNRGPLLLDKEKVKELNYLDEEHYRHENSDHDLMLRAFLYKKYICGYVPIDFNAPLINGSTRKNSDQKNINKKIELQNKGLWWGHYINNYRNVWQNLEPRQYNLNFTHKIVFDFENENGFFSVFFFFLQTYIYCKTNNILLYIKDNNWKFKHTKGLDDYLILNNYISKYPITTNDNDNNNNNIICTHNKSVNINYNLNTYRKYSKELFNIDKNILNEYNLPDEYNTIFIRGGDKLLYEAQKIHVKHYINKLYEIDRNTKNLFIHSDDNLIVQEVEDYIKENNIAVNSFKITDNTGNGGAVIMNRLKYGTCSNIKSVDDMSSYEKNTHTTLFLNAIEIMRKSKNIICSFDTNVSRFMKLNFDNNVYSVNTPNIIDFDKITHNPSFGF
jgi:glycosyltransferase involved in cell wall biosynthesis